LSGRRVRRTKIVATIGPASDPPDVLRGVLEAGADVARVGLAHGPVEALPDHPAVADQDRAHHRVRAGASASALGERERLAHVQAVAVYHFSSNSAFTYSSGENGIKSSIASPTPT
jgi:pyruvate kinase